MRIKPFLTQYIKLKSVSFLIFNIVFVLNSTAQMTFYVNPKLGTSLSFTSVADQPKYTPFGGTIPSPYSLSKNASFRKSPTVPYGLAFGVLLGNKRHKIEFEWEKSAISYKVETFVRDYKFAENSWLVVNPSINQKINRFNVNYAYLLTKNPTKTSIWVNASSGISLSSMFDLDMGRVFNNYFFTPTAQLDYISFQPVSQTNVNVTFKVGFDVDFYAKEKYILSLSLSYLQGFGKLQRNELHIGYKEYNDDFSITKVKDFSKEIYSRGSNFQLSISRRLQIYPWRPNKKSDTSSCTLK